MRLDENRAAMLVGVFLVLMLGVITATYMTMFPPTTPTVSCTAATGCDIPERERPAPELSDDYT